MSIYSKKTFTPCEFVKLYSQEVWDKLGKVKATSINEQKLKFDETSLTQEFIYLFDKLTVKGSHHIFENNAEPTSGADIELKIVSKSKDDGFHAYIQCKRVYPPNQKYNALNTAHGKLQVDKLIDYVTSKGNGAIPMYLFYNHFPGSCHYAPEDFGLTFTPAVTMKSKYKNSTTTPLEWLEELSFETLHNIPSSICEPFSVLFCPEAFKSNLKAITFPFDIALKFLDKSELRRTLLKIKLNELLDKNGKAIKIVEKRIKNGNYGVVNMADLKNKEISEIQKTEWLKGYTVFGESSSFEDSSQQVETLEGESILRARYKMILFID